MKAAGYFTGYIGKHHATVGPVNEHQSYMKENVDFCYMKGEHGLGGKTFLYEESIRIPMIFYSPLFSKKDRGITVDELVGGQDLPATILDLCGLPVFGTYQGQSMVPLIEGKRKEVFCENLFTDQWRVAHL